MSMKSKLATTALLASWRQSALATTNANARLVFVPENATRFCDDVTFLAASYHRRRRKPVVRYIPPPRHGGRPRARPIARQPAISKKRP